MFKRLNRDILEDYKQLMEQLDDGEDLWEQMIVWPIIRGQTKSNLSRLDNEAHDVYMNRVLYETGVSPEELNDFVHTFKV